MKKIALSILTVSTFLFGSCSNEDSSSPENLAYNATTNVTLKAGSVSSSRTKANNKPHEVDSVVVSVSSLELNVDGQTVTFTKDPGTAYIDLLSFESKDTLIWSEEELPVGELHSAVLGLDKDEDSYVVETDGNHADLHISHKELDFDIESDSAIAADTKYVIKLDMAGSLRLVKKGNGGYNLQQGTAGAPKEGVLILQKVD
ncbi:DUF4382 domain-containing protein [Flammeovirga sp. SubArs3]|uniref:DUF4382 domain-containing protein n=1 Tax=Flammeovirga sp. SubArs3 TaxID=2995316 RepID=UPI00248C2A43|nr:DUF4382 domain-containing protein [Flammeovirga sp. SubArs3]